MSDRPFIRQSQLEEWLSAGTANLTAAQGGPSVLTESASGRSYPIVEAVRVVALLDGKDDQGLVGRVLTRDEVVAIKGEHSQGMVMLGDNAFQCEDGFVEATAAAPEPKPRSDSELLADFLLKGP